MLVSFSNLFNKLLYSLKYIAIISGSNVVPPLRFIGGNVFKSCFSTLLLPPTVPNKYCIVANFLSIGDNASYFLDQNL